MLGLEPSRDCFKVRYDIVLIMEFRSSRFCAELTASAFPQILKALIKQFTAFLLAMLVMGFGFQQQLFALETDCCEEVESCCVSECCSMLFIGADPNCPCCLKAPLRSIPISIPSINAESQHVVAAGSNLASGEIDPRPTSDSFFEASFLAQAPPPPLRTVLALLQVRLT